jgi:hypothetical protein
MLLALAGDPLPGQPARCNHVGRYALSDERVEGPQFRRRQSGRHPIEHPRERRTGPAECLPTDDGDEVLRGLQVAIVGEEHQVVVSEAAVAREEHPHVDGAPLDRFRGDGPAGVQRQERREPQSVHARESGQAELALRAFGRSSQRER